MGKTLLISHQNRRERLKSSSEDFDAVNSSRESMSSDESNTSAQLKIPAQKQNGRGVRRFRRKRRTPVQTVYKNKKSFSRIRQREFPKNFTSSPTCTSHCGNHFSTPLYLPTSNQSFPGVRPFQRQPNGYVESVSEHENLSSTFHSKSSKFHMSSQPPFHTSVAFNDPTSGCCKIKECSDNTFRSEKQISCSSTRISRPAASSGKNKLILDCIRNSQIPINIYRSLNSSTTSSRSRSYSSSLSFNTTHSTPKYHSALEEISPIETASQMTSSPYSNTSHNIPKDSPALKESISPCSTMVEVGSMETIMGNTISSSSTSEPNSFSEGCHYSSELIYDASPNGRASQTSSKESWDSEDSIESINHSLCLDSDYFYFKGNFTYPKSVSGENGENNTPLKNENSSKISMFPVRRQCPSQLQMYSSPSITSTSPFRESKHIENAIESISRPSPHSAILYHCPVIRSSNDSKATNLLFEENARRYTTLDSNDSLMSSLCPGESLPNPGGEFLAALNPPESITSLKESHSTENTVESVRQCFASLPMMYGPPMTDASEIAIPSNKSNSEQSEHSKNKTRKTSKLISCFTACLRPSSPRQEGQF